MYVSGCFLVVWTTKLGKAIPNVQPVNQSVPFLKERDIILSNDHWHIAIGLNCSEYEEAISVVRQDLMLIRDQEREFTPIAALEQIEDLLNSLEAKLQHFYQFLLRYDKKRGIMNVGGIVFKSLFGVSVRADTYCLQNTLEKLQASEDYVAHSLENQVTYIRNLDQATRVNSQMLFNLSTTV